MSKGEPSDAILQVRHYLWNIYQCLILHFAHFTSDRSNWWVCTDCSCGLHSRYFSCIPIFFCVLSRGLWTEQFKFFIDFLFVIHFTLFIILFQYRTLLSIPFRPIQYSWNMFSYYCIDISWLLSVEFSQFWRLTRFPACNSLTFCYGSKSIAAVWFVDMKNTDIKTFHKMFLSRLYYSGDAVAENIRAVFLNPNRKRFSSSYGPAIAVLPHSKHSIIELWKKKTRFRPKWSHIHNSEDNGGINSDFYFQICLYSSR